MSIVILKGADFTGATTFPNMKRGSENSQVADTGSPVSRDDTANTDTCNDEGHNDVFCGDEK